MKKLILSIGILAFSFVAMAQNSLVVLYNGVEVSNDFSVNIDSVLNPLFYNEAIVYAQVKNISSSDLTIKLRRTVIDSVSGSLNQICFGGLCFAPEVWDSPTVETLNPGEVISDESFSGHYLPNGRSGLSKIRYTFYNVLNPNDTASFIVNFGYEFLPGWNYLVLYYDGVPVPNDYIVNIDSILQVDMYNEAIVYAQVKNTTSDTVSIKVRRTLLDSVPSSQNQICFAGLCFSPDVWNSITTEDLEAGEFTDEESFSGHYLPNGQVGLTKVRYTFYDIASPNDTTSLIVNFNYGYLSVDDLLAKSNISAAYPNPAKSVVNFEYQFNSQVTSASVKIYNLVGQQVKVENINGLIGKCEISVVELPEGVYFATLVLNDHLAKTQRIIVKR